MQTILPGSRGAVRLHVRGSRSTDEAGTVFVAAQKWSFLSQHSSRSLNFSLSPFNSHNGSSSRKKLTPPTIPASLDRLSLYPECVSEAGSSVDADIIAAQQFLRTHNPDIEIPDFVLSDLIRQNAHVLEDTAHHLDGSLGLAEAQAIAVLGPVTLAQKRIFAVICIGGRNRDCLLLHQLQVQPDIVSALDAGTAEHATSTQSEGKAKATESSKLSFIPAHDIERKYKTPILQIVASPDNKFLAVRTHSSTSFLFLNNQDRADRPPSLHLDTLHTIQYGTNGSSQHQDICFSPGSSKLAAAVDRLGNIDLFSLQTERPQSQQADPTSGLPAPCPSADCSSLSGSMDRRSFPLATIVSAPIDSLLLPPTAVSRIPAELLFAATTETMDTIPTTTDPTIAGATLAPQISKTPPFRVIFGPDHGSLFLLTRYSLNHIKLDDQGRATHFEGAQQISTILRSRFCLNSFRPARFFSMTSSEVDSGPSLLAVCSSDSILWFDQQNLSEPLFATPHYRGDDPTLTLTKLPSIRSGSTASYQQETNLSLWALSSRRNHMITCYTVRSVRQDGPGLDLLQGETASLGQPLRWRHALDEAPTLLPVVSSTHEPKRPAAPLLFLDAAQLWHDDQNHHQGFNSWIAFETTDRGALLAQVLRADLNTPSESLSQNDGVDLKIMQPSLDTLLYLDDSNASLVDQAESSSDVKTRILNFEKLHSTLFTPNDSATTSAQAINDITGAQRGPECLLNLRSNPASSHPSVHAATLSLCQLFRQSTQHAGDGIQSSTGRKGSPTSLWSTPVQVGLDEKTQTTIRTAILDFRSDARHALLSLGVSPSQRAWSRMTNTVAGRQADGATDQNGHVSPDPVHADVLERALSCSRNKIDVGPYLPSKATVQPWSANTRRLIQESLRDASRQMMLDLGLQAEIFVRPKARILDEGAPTQRPQQRPGTNWTALEHRNIYNFVEEQGDTIPPPHIGSVGLSFFAPLRSGDVEAVAGSGDPQIKKALNEADLETLLPSTSSTARLLLAEWQLGEDPTEYTYLDPFEGLHRLPRASRLRGPTARARSRSFSRASSASTEDRSRSRSRSRKQSAAPSFSQSNAYASQGPPSSYPPSLASQSQSAITSGAPPTLASRRQRQRNAIVSRSQPIRDPLQGFEPTRLGTTPTSATVRGNPLASSAAQSQPAAPRFGFGGSFGDLTPTVSPASSQIGIPTNPSFGASTQIEAGRFGARPVQADQPPKKKKRAIGF